MARFMRTDKETEQKSSESANTVSATEASPAPEQRPAGSPSHGGERSIISASLKVTGNIESEAEIQLDGKVDGDVRGKVVTIGESADVTGSVHGEMINLAGTINGTIEARTVVVAKTARITGDIIHESLQIEAGAYVDGHCRPEFGKAKGAPPKPAGTGARPDIKVADPPPDAPGAARA